MISDGLVSSNNFRKSRFDRGTTTRSFGANARLSGFRADFRLGKAMARWKEPTRELRSGSKKNPNPRKTNTSPSITRAVK
jgi:hypothetical protein